MSELKVRPKQAVTEELFAAPKQRVCGICERHVSQYTCPRCGIAYCGLTCYKDDRHADCSEGFYKEQFVDGLKHKTASDTERRKMLDTLKRFEEENVDESSIEGTIEEEDRVDDLAQRFAGVDLDSADANAVWDRLTTEEQQRFLAMVQDGTAAEALLTPWSPWWLELPKNKALAEPVLPASWPSTFPADVIPEFSKLTNGKPAARELPFNLAEMVTAYTYVVRFHHGEHHDCSLEAMSLIVFLCSCLGRAALMTAAGTAVQTVCQALVATDDLPGPDTLTLCEDTMTVFSHISAPAVLLADLYTLCQGALTELKAQKGTGQYRPDEWKQHKKSFKAIQAKLLFYISWYSGLGQSEQKIIVGVINAQVGAELESWRQEQERFKATQPSAEADHVRTSHRLVQEL